MRYLNEYKRYLNFVKSLRDKLREDIPKDRLVQALILDINSNESLSRQEKKLFESEEAVLNILQNPMLEIAYSIKELNHILEKKHENMRHAFAFGR